VDSDSLFGNFLQLAASRFGRGKSSVIKQTLEMQSEDTSATRDPLKEACLARGWLGERAIEGLTRLTAPAKPCSLFTGTQASSALGCRRQRRASIGSIGILQGLCKKCVKIA
jgi:hypothetical protein